MVMKQWVQAANDNTLSAHLTIDRVKAIILMMAIVKNNCPDLIPMQVTRQQILEILKTRTEATVDEVVEDLRQRRGDDITPVTVRHHLTRLQESGLVDTARMQHRDTPGRPRHVYRLTERGVAYFPGNYQKLAAGLLAQIEKHLSQQGVNVILEGVAQQMAQEAGIIDGSLPERLNAVIAYLTENGYEAHWETAEQGYILHTVNCPYHQIAQENDALCYMDMRLISGMLGVIPRLLKRIAAGDNTCSYFIPCPVME